MFDRLKRGNDVQPFVEKIVDCLLEIENAAIGCVSTSADNMFRVTAADRVVCALGFTSIVDRQLVWADVKEQDSSPTLFQSKRVQDAMKLAQQVDPSINVTSPTVKSISSLLYSVFGVRLKLEGTHVYLEMAAVLEPLLEHKHRLIPKGWFEEKWKLGVLELDHFKVDYDDTNRKLRAVLSEFQTGASEFHVQQCEHLRKLLAVPDQLRMRTNLKGTAPLPFAPSVPRVSIAAQASIERRRIDTERHTAGYRHHKAPRSEVRREHAYSAAREAEREHLAVPKRKREGDL
jgi:hypothetical protein